MHVLVRRTCGCGGSHGSITRGEGTYIALHISTKNAWPISKSSERVLLLLFSFAHCGLSASCLSTNSTITLALSVHRERSAWSLCPWRANTCPLPPVPPPLPPSLPSFPSRSTDAPHGEVTPFYAMLLFDVLLGFCEAGRRKRKACTRTMQSTY